MANTQSLIPPNIDYGKISADKYDPDGTYTKGDLRIQNNALWKSKQNIDVPEPWTPAHWDATTIAAELKAQAEDISDLNSRMPYEKTITGSITDGLGTFPTGLSFGDYIVLAAYNNSTSWIYVPFVASSDGTWRLRVTTANGNPVGNTDSTQVTILVMDKLSK